MNQQQEVQRRILYQGRVQGVGFRYTVSSIAKRFPVAGYVKNLSDGRVEVVAQTTEPVLEQFLHEIDAAFPENITDRFVEEVPETESFSGFRIRY